MNNSCKRVYCIDVTIYQKCLYSLLNELIGYLSVYKNACWDAEVRESQPGR